MVVIQGIDRYLYSLLRFDLFCGFCFLCVHNFLKWACFGLLSPHIQTIRERISLGRLGEPVSSKVLNSLFHSVKESIDKAIELENGRISHFEVLLIIVQHFVSFSSLSKVLSFH